MADASNVKHLLNSPGLPYNSSMESTDALQVWCVPRHENATGFSFTENAVEVVHGTREQHRALHGRRPNDFMG